jgi:hypothetical protein
MVKRGAGNGRGHVVLPIPFRTNSSYFAFCSITAGIVRGGEQPERYYHVPGESQPAYSPNIKKGVAKSFLMPAAAGAPLSQPTMLRR